MRTRRCLWLRCRHWFRGCPLHVLILRSKSGKNLSKFLQRSSEPFKWGVFWWGTHRSHAKTLLLHGQSLKKGPNRNSQILLTYWRGWLSKIQRELSQCFSWENQTNLQWNYSKQNWQQGLCLGLFLLTK